MCVCWAEEEGSISDSDGWNIRKLFICKLILSTVIIHLFEVINVIETPSEVWWSLCLDVQMFWQVGSLLWQIDLILNVQELNLT